MDTSSYCWGARKVYEVGVDSPEYGLFICTNCKSQIIPISKGDNFSSCLNAKKRHGGNC